MPEDNYINEGSAVPPQAGVGQPTSYQTDSALTRESQAVENSEQSEQLRSPAQASSREISDDAKQRVQTLKQETEEYVRKNPAKAIFTALGIGFVLGLMRRH